jgi:diguanylate cyclase (GGDEF)-like protein/PAS domain S-box-containing protein
MSAPPDIDDPVAIPPHAAACALLDGAHGLAAWPGPAVVLDRNGAVLAANDAAKALIGPAPDDLLSHAVARGQPARVTVAVGAGAAMRRFDCAVMPLAAGDSALVLARDATLDGGLRDALVESRQRYKDLVEISGDFCWETGPDGRFVFVSPRGAAGWRADELVGRDAALFVENCRDTAAPLPFAAHIRIEDVDTWFLHRDGEARCLSTTAMPLFTPDGVWCGARGLCRDVTDARRRDAAHARDGLRERLLAHVARAIRDEIEPARMIAAAATATARALAADDCRIVALANDGTAPPAAERAGADAALVARAAETGQPADGVAGGRRVLAVVTSFRGQANGAVVIERDAQQPPWPDADRSLAADVAAQIGIALAQIDRERRLEVLSRTDPLTGLLNRRAFEAELDGRLDRGGLSSAPGTLVYVDLDNFKTVNDRGGHARGDEALRAVADLLLRSTRPGDLVARLGGDEFALWLERTDAPTAARRAAELIAAAGTLAVFSGDATHPFGFSIGAAVFAPGSGESPAALGRRADAAMYGVKRDGKSGFAIAPPASDERAVQPVAASA